MGKRIHTVIIVPHSKADFIKFSFSSRTFVVVASVALVAVVLSVVAIGFTGSAVDRRADVSRLEAENLELARVNKELEGTITSVQQRLDEFEERTSRLALAAGMMDEDGDRMVLENRESVVNAGGPYTRLRGDIDTLKLQGDTIADQLFEVEQVLVDQELKFSSTPTIAPVIGVITDGFGSRRDPFTGRLAHHNGLDLSARRGTPIMAPADGVVVFAGRNGGMGRMIRISHGFGFQTAYGHLDSIQVEPGQDVHRGEQIGLLGNTGRSTGPHLHYEVHKDGRAVNPLYYILDAY
ncbi:MAG: hypothetical protein DRJ65_06650 [Acidobacteria bacterium]|nr:MAG: hypothetical protein DRJ65_06650 [Acidobacteriota bacterium]